MDKRHLAQLRIPVTAPTNRWGRLLGHPWIVGVVGGALAGVIAGLVLLHIYGPATTPAPSVSVSPSVVIKATATPDLLRQHARDRTITVTASGLTPNGPVAVDVELDGGGGESYRTADGQGKLEDQETPVGPNVSLSPGDTVTITVIDETTDGLAVVHVEVVP